VTSEFFLTKLILT